MSAVELKPINAWSVHKPKYSGYVGKYRDAAGHGVSGWFEREYKHTKHVIALDNGHVMSRYRFAKVHIPFSSPMHRWENLWFCGGWSTQGPNGERVDSKEELLQAVISGLKPMGFIICSEQKQAEEYAKQAQAAGLVVAVNDNSISNDTFPFEVACCQDGIIGQMFDTDALFDSYLRLGCGWVLRHAGYQERTIQSLAHKTLSEFLTGWNYANPKDEFDLIIIGFLLGFPIESTVACINGER